MSQCCVFCAELFVFGSLSGINNHIEAMVLDSFKLYTSRCYLTL